VFVVVIVIRVYPALLFAGVVVVCCCFCFVCLIVCVELICVKAVFLLLFLYFLLFSAVANDRYVGGSWL